MLSMNCIICNSGFVKKVHNQTMCSTVCVKRYRNNWMKADYKKKNLNKKVRQANCVVCKNVFEVKNNKGRPISCSLECSYINHKNRIKAWQYKSKYGITIEQYRMMLVAQNNACAICFIDKSKCSNGLYVDHDHQTGQLRGLLCQKCNSALGLLGDSWTTIMNAVGYVQKFKKLKLIK